MTVSMPEKTLEHWCSAYINNRFPSAHLWWPVAGEDVSIRSLTGGSGGALTWAGLLELKTTTWDARRLEHVLNIDGAQLARYLFGTSATPAYTRGSIPVYYVFPGPFWEGVLVPGAKADKPPRGGGVTSVFVPQEWWRRRADLEWFGNWVYVIPAESVWLMLGTADRLAAESRRPRVGSRARLKVCLGANRPRVDPERSVGWAWKTSPGAPPIAWPDFWRTGPSSSASSFWSASSLRLRSERSMLSIETSINSASVDEPDENDNGRPDNESEHAFWATSRVAVTVPEN